MPGPELILLAPPRAAVALLAYGPVPGVELIPYFLALLAWVGLAFAGVLWTPIAALLRWLRGTRGDSGAKPGSESVALSNTGERRDGKAPERSDGVAYDP